MKCIAYPNYPLGYSETFIKTHLGGLDWDFRLCHSWYPYRDELTAKPALGFPFLSLWTNGGLRRLSPQIYEKAYTYQLANYLKKNQVKLLLAEYGLTGANMTGACRQAGTILITHFHGADAYQHAVLKQYEKKYQAMFAYSRHIIAVSRAMQTQLINLGAPKEKVLYIPYGIDSKLFTATNPAQNGLNFVAIGRFTAKKAPHITLKAFEQVLQKFPEARLQMIGEGGLLAHTKKLAYDIGITQQVDFLGILNPIEVHQVLQKARAFVQHSVVAPDGDSEGTPNVILEAGMTGLPVVSTRHAGIKDAIQEDKTGFLVDEYDTNAMANAMIQLAEKPDLAQTMGRQARAYIKENFDKEYNLKKLRDIIIF